MARNRTPVAGGEFVLDSEGFSRMLSRDPWLYKILTEGRGLGFKRVISAATILEASHAKVNRARWDFVLSELRIEPVSVDIAREGAELLRSTGLSGHKYAIDAMVAATAMRQPGPVIMLTSDVDDMAKLCDKRVRFIGL